MSVRKNCPCDIDGVCPYNAESWIDCECFCNEEDELNYWKEIKEGELPYWEEVEELKSTFSDMKTD